MKKHELSRQIADALDYLSPTTDNVLNTMAIMEAVEAYADAQVAAKDKSIEGLVAQNLDTFKKLQQQESENHLKDAEIKRLRDFANQCFKSPEKLAVIHYFENGEFDYCDLVPLQDAATNALSPAPVTEDKFSVSAYPKECSPTIEQLTETDDLTMMQRLGKRMPPFHGVAPVTEAKNEDQV